MSACKYNVFVFDFDGVIVESVDVKTEAFAALFSDRGDDAVEAVVDFHLRNGGVSRYEKFKYYYREIFKEPLSDEKLKELSEKFSRLVVEKVVEAPFVKGADVFLSRYASAFRFFVASGTPEEELRRIVSRRGLQPFFRGVYGSPLSKRELVEKIAREENARKDAVLFFGDSMTDYEAAKQCGVDFAGRKAKGAESAFPPDACFLFEDFTAVPHVLGLD